MERTVTVTLSQLAQALAEWENEAKVNKWPERGDLQRFVDAADHLMDLISGYTVDGVDA